MTNELWCIHVPGPDDFYAAPSKEAAEAVAARYNAAMKKNWEALQKTKTPDALQFYPPIESVMARVCEWPNDPKSHSVELWGWDDIVADGLL